MDEDTLNAVWNQTMEEVEAGELSGPYHVEQIPLEFPLSKRFGIKQSSKVRCVDDFIRIIHQRLCSNMRVAKTTYS